jgi:hypothetical protein
MLTGRTCTACLSRLLAELDVLFGRRAWFRCRVQIETLENQLAALKEVALPNKASTVQVADRAVEEARTQLQSLKRNYYKSEKLADQHWALLTDEPGFVSKRLWGLSANCIQFRTNPRKAT